MFAISVSHRYSSKPLAAALCGVAWNYYSQGLTMVWKQRLTIHLVTHKTITIRIHRFAERHATTESLFPMEFNKLTDFVVRTDTKTQQNITEPHSTKLAISHSIVPTDGASCLLYHILLVTALPRAAHHARHCYLLEVLLELPQ
jgi:hypothetical protein